MGGSGVARMCALILSLGLARRYRWMFTWRRSSRAERVRESNAFVCVCFGELLGGRIFIC